MRRKCRRGVRSAAPLRLAAGIAGLLIACLAQAQKSAISLAGLDQEIEQIRRDIPNVGVSVAIVRDDKIVYARGFGSKEYGKPDKVDADTVFEIGSTSKAFTAAAVGILVDEGKVGWDDAVVDHLVGFRVRDPWVTRELTLRDALAHRTGLSEGGLFVRAVIDEDQAVRGLDQAPQGGAFRSSFWYSNLMYAVAGKVVSQVSGKRWGEFVQERLFAPLHMTRSATSLYRYWDRQYVTPTFFGSPASDHFNHSDAKDPNVAMPHIIDEHGVTRVMPWQSYENAAPAGAIVSSAKDIGNWLIMHLNGGRFDGRQIVQEKTVEELHALQNASPIEDQFPFDEPQGYALGWFKARYRSSVYLWHTGGIVGFPAYVVLLPREKLGLVVLSNGPTGAGDRYALNEAIGFHIVDRLLGARPRAWGKEYAARIQAAEERARARREKLLAERVKNAPPSVPLEEYVGDYADHERREGRVSVGLQAGRLVLSYAGEGALYGFLDPWNFDVFHFRPPRELGWDDFPVFSLDASGKVASMKAFGTVFDRVKTGSHK
jgi:CubicO group peptidase (beta-lactamase class C family)